MRAAKERKRMAFGATMLDVGGITTDGQEPAMTPDTYTPPIGTSTGGKGSAIRRASSADKYASGWIRVLARQNRSRMDDGHKDGSGAGPGGRRAKNNSGAKAGQGGNNVKKVRQCVDNANRFA